MKIGSYQVLFELARGGMGTVFLGRLIGAGGFERLVAIKRAHPRLAKADELAERFLNEARLTAHVHHANVVGIHQVGSDSEGPYLVYDYVEGESLAGLIDRSPRPHQLPRPVVLRILIDGLAGLHAAHETVDVGGQPLNMLHRDVSVENLLVGVDGVTRLADFGIAKSVLSNIITEEGIVHGKLIYFAPEYLRRESVDRRLDVYAMGVTMWIALSGTLPWKDEDAPQVLQRIVSDGIPMLADFGVEVEPELEAIVLKACARNPKERFKSAREMLDALEALGTKKGTVASHVEVAEHVERVVGASLRDRRNKIRARRVELDRLAQAAPQASAALVDAHTEPHPTPAPAVPKLSPAGVPISAQPTEVMTSQVLLGSNIRGRGAKRLMYAAVLVVGLAAGYGLFAVASAGSRTRDAATEGKLMGAAHAGDKPPAVPSAPVVTPLEEKPEPAQLEEPAADAAKAPLAAPPAKKPRARPATPGDKPALSPHRFSDKNPYR